jgi:hypothetical protein
MSINSTKISGEAEIRDAMIWVFQHHETGTTAVTEDVGGH